MLADVLNSDALRAAGYLLAAGLSFAAAMKVRSDGGATVGSPEGRVFLFWLGLAVLLAFLGIGRLADLGPWLTDRGREVAEAQGWYDERRPAQARAVRAILAAGAAGVAIGILWFLRAASRQHPLGFIAIVCLVTFVLVRAISWHPVDRILYTERFDGVRPNAVIELAGTGLMLVAAGLALALPRMRVAASSRR